MDSEMPGKNPLKEGTDLEHILEPLQFYDPFLDKLHLNNWFVTAGIGALSTTGLYSWHLLNKLTILQVIVGSVVVPVCMAGYLLLPGAITGLFKLLISTPQFNLLIEFVRSSSNLVLLSPLWATRAISHAVFSTVQSRSNCMRFFKRIIRRQGSSPILAKGDECV